jgi:transcriptional regulator with XRE-family HTH domain
MEMKDVAEKVGVTPSAISAIEIGSRTPSWDTLCKICNVMGIEVSLVTMLVESKSPTVKTMLPMVYNQLWERSQEHAGN